MERVNISLGAEEERQLNSGLHAVSDINCNGCCTKLGWKYVYAFDEDQKYKEGTFIVEVYALQFIAFAE